ncbi:prolipoprotein diacylglyceryl transferase [Candidatus Shapirobacteria bacterium]|nr:prolipoprotein diacylglyceryl transferase [Candidatus Shapirobacteria bacterium]
MELWPYSTFCILAAVVVVGGTGVAATKRKMAGVKVLITLLMAATGAFVGARGLYVLTNLQNNKVSYWDWNFHNFSLYGGIMVAMAMGFMAARLLKINPIKLADVTTPFVGIGIALIRVGCYLHGCCFGTETTLPWGVKFAPFSPAHIYQLRQEGGEIFEVHPVHPTQIYELIAALMGSMIATIVLKRKMKNGAATIIFWTWFSACRLIIHFLRQPSSPLDGSMFYPVLYVLIVVLGMTYVYKRKLLARQLLG